MRKRTRAWAFVAQEANRLAGLGCSPAEIASEIGVFKSTVTRWIKAGKLKLAATVVEITDATVRAKKTPAEWAQAIRDEYNLDDTDEQLVTLGESALTISQDRSAKRTERLNASRAFQSIVTQLKLVTRRAVKEEEQQPEKVAAIAAAKPKNPPVRRRSAADPRAAFMRIVK